MRKKVILINVSLLLFHFLTESHSLVSTISKDFGDQPYDFFLSSDFKMQLPIKWYLKMNFDSLLVLVILFLWGKTALYHSRRLAYTLGIWVVYHMLDLWFFWFDYKSSWATYWVMLVFSAILIIVLSIPVKEKAKVINME
jgi:hypothetical protein